MVIIFRNGQQLIFLVKQNLHVSADGKFHLKYELDSSYLCVNLGVSMLSHL